MTTEQLTAAHALATRVAVSDPRQAATEYERAAITLARAVLVLIAERMPEAQPVRLNLSHMAGD